MLILDDSGTVNLTQIMLKCRIGFLVLDEAYADDVSALVLQEESNALEATGVARPTTRAGYTSWELFRSIPVGHAPCKLELGV